MKVLFRTERTPAVSKDLGLGHPAAAGVTWFEFVLHEGPPDEKTWEGGGQTVAYWRTQFARTRNPRPWTIQASGVDGVAPAVIPDDIVNNLPEDARISFVWTFLPDGITKSSGAGAP
jgi:hypothetical protein